MTLETSQSTASNQFLPKYWEVPSLNMPFIASPLLNAEGMPMIVMTMPVMTAATASREAFSIRQ